MEEKEEEDDEDDCDMVSAMREGRQADDDELVPTRHGGNGPRECQKLVPSERQSSAG